MGVNKNHISFLPVCLDDFVGEKHICRVISAFTELLDMEKLGHKYSVCQKTGCPPYNLKMMLNLYIYGYLQGVNYSRKLRDEAQRNIEVMRLMDKLQTDDKTICNFRKDNIEALRKTFREFSLMCRKLGLYGDKTIAIDSTKVRVNNSRKNNHNRVSLSAKLPNWKKE